MSTIFDELKPKNIVKCKVSNDAAFYQVMAIDAMHRRVMLGGVRYGQWYAEGKIKPIKLTPEILEKSGFCYDEYNDNYTIDRFYFVLEEQEQSLWIYEPNNGRHRNKCMFIAENIRHLHQLQNLYFALTGQELQVNI